MWIVKHLTEQGWMRVCEVIRDRKEFSTQAEADAFYQTVKPTNTQYEWWSAPEQKA